MRTGSGGPAENKVIGSRSKEVAESDVPRMKANVRMKMKNQVPECNEW